MTKKLFCLCAALIFAFAAMNVANAHSAAGDCPCAAPCKCAAPCAPCAAPCAAPCYYPAAYPYYYPPVAYRVGFFGCVRPVVAYPWYGYGYGCGYYPRCWW